MTESLFKRFEEGLDAVFQSALAKKTQEQIKEDKSVLEQQFARKANKTLKNIPDNVRIHSFTYANGTPFYEMAPQQQRTAFDTAVRFAEGLTIHDIRKMPIDKLMKYEPEDTDKGELGSEVALFLKTAFAKNPELIRREKRVLFEQMKNTTLGYS